MKRRVVITGLGTVSGLGLNTTAFWQALTAGQSAIKPLILPIENIKISKGALVPEFNPESYFSSQDLTLLDRYSQLAVIAAREAVDDASLTSNKDIVTRAAAIIGSGCGGKHTDEATYDQLYKQQRPRAHPLTIPASKGC